MAMAKLAIISSSPDAKLREIGFDQRRVIGMQHALPIQDKLSIYVTLFLDPYDKVSGLLVQK
jgi:hypothetical protein